MTGSTTSDEVISGRWQLDARRSSVGFRARHLWGLGTVEGHFADYRGHLDIGASPAIELTIEAASVETGNHRRDKHLRSRAFLGADEHPRMQFVSDSVDARGDALEVRGRLSVRGQSIPLEVVASVRRLTGDLEIDVAVTVSHRELGMTFNPLGMIPPCSELFVRAHLIPDAGGPHHPAGAVTT